MSLNNKLMFLTENPQAIYCICSDLIHLNSTVLNRFPFIEGSFQPHHKPLNLPHCSLRQNKLPGWQLQQSRIPLLFCVGHSTHPPTFTFITSNSKRERAAENRCNFTTAAQGVLQPCCRGRGLSLPLLKELIKQPGQQEAALNPTALCGQGQKQHDT